jgi:flagellar biosynthesis/type III secretory pathway M-ring protein FliF/YscJ
MSVKLHRPAAHRAGEAEAVVTEIWGPADTEQLQTRLAEIARCRPSAVAHLLEHWLHTPHGESHFDVKS